MSRTSRKVALMAERAERLREMAGLARNPKIAAEMRDRAEHVTDMALFVLNKPQAREAATLRSRAACRETRTIPAFEVMAADPTRARLIDRLKQSAAEMRTRVAEIEATAAAGGGT
jgi:hypothetical protein